MKKITLIVAMLFFVFIANAQLFNIWGVDVGYLYVGPKLGGNAAFNTIEESGSASKTANYGYQFGAVGKLGLTQKLCIQTELVYRSKGYAEENDFYKANSNYKYIGIPILAKYAFAAISGISVYGSGGFYTEYMTGGEITFKWEGTGQPDESTKITDFSPYNRVDFGLNIGAGADIPFKNKDQLNVDMRFGYGFVDLESQGSSSSSKNITIELSAIYLVDLTKWVSFKGSSKTNDDAYEENSAPAGGSKVEQE